MQRWAKVSLAAFAAMTLAASAAAAQSANISVTANVFQALTVAGSQGLDFGDVFPGVNKTVAPADATSGRFSITGQNSAPVDLTFSLPASLDNAGTPMTITAWAGVHNTANSAAGGTGFTPSATATTASLSASGQLFVFIGATVQPAANQAAGTYTGTVTLTVAYN